MRAAVPAPVSPERPRERQGERRHVIASFLTGPADEGLEKMSPHAPRRCRCASLRRKEAFRDRRVMRAGRGQSLHSVGSLVAMRPERALRLDSSPMAVSGIEELQAGWRATARVIRHRSFAAIEQRLPRGSIAAKTQAAASAMTRLQRIMTEAAHSFE